MPSNQDALFLRPETAQDEPFLEILHRSTRNDLLQLGLPEPILENLMRMQFNAQQSGYRAQYPSADFAVIERGGMPVGYQIAEHGDETIRLVYLALLPQERNLGHGKTLLRALLAEAAGANKSLILAVARHNLQARHVYLSCGFKIVNDDGVNLEMTWCTRDNP